MNMDQSTNFFLIRGNAKSGTNWVQNILRLHPDIYCKGEVHLGKLRKEFDMAITSGQSLLSIDKRMGEFSEEAFEDFVKKCLVRMSEIYCGRPVKLIGERTPATLEPFLLKNVPNILIIRDGRDALVSAAYHVMRSKKTAVQWGGGPNFAENKRIFAQDPFYFVKNPKKLLTDEKWFRLKAKGWADHIRSDFNTIEKINSQIVECRLHVVRYEELHRNIEREREKMYLFLGVDPQKALPVTGLVVPGFGRKDGTEDPESHYRKGQAGDWKRYFTEENVRWFREEAGEALAMAGFEKDDNWRIL